MLPPLKERVGFLIRSLSLQGSWSFPYMQGLGFFFVISPWLKKQNGDYDLNALKRHLVYFNTHPFMASYLLGVVAKLEMDGKRKAAIRAKDTLMGPMGASGDGLFWASIGPLVVTLSLCISLLSPLAGILTLILTHNAIQLSVRWKLFNRGWENADDPLNYIGKRQDRKIAVQAQEIIAPLSGFLLGIVAIRSGTPGTVLFLFALSLILFVKGWSTSRTLLVILTVSLIMGWLGIRMEIPWFPLK